MVGVRKPGDYSSALAGTHGIAYPLLSGPVHLLSTSPDSPWRMIDNETSEVYLWIV